MSSSNNGSNSPPPYKLVKSPSTSPPLAAVRSNSPPPLYSSIIPPEPDSKLNSRAREYVPVGYTPVIRLIPHNFIGYTGYILNIPNRKIKIYRSMELSLYYTMDSRLVQLSGDIISLINGRVIVLENSDHLQMEDVKRRPLSPPRPVMYLGSSLLRNDSEHSVARPHPHPRPHSQQSAAYPPARAHSQQSAAHSPARAHSQQSAAHSPRPVHQRAHSPARAHSQQSAAHSPRPVHQRAHSPQPRPPVVKKEIKTTAVDSGFVLVSEGPSNGRTIYRTQKGYYFVLTPGGSKKYIDMNIKSYRPAD